MPKKSTKPGTKRKASSASCELSESPPVPKKSSATQQFQEPKESKCSDVEFLREVNKYAVPGELMLVPPGDKFLDLKSPCFRFISYRRGVNFGFRRKLWGPRIVRLPLVEVTLELFLP